jgi:hypothetical protein
MSFHCFVVLLLLAYLAIQTHSFQASTAFSSSSKAEFESSTKNTTQSSLVRRKPIDPNNYLNCIPGRLPRWLIQSLVSSVGVSIRHYRDAYEICSNDSSRSRNAACSCVDPDQDRVQCREGDADPVIFNTPRVVNFCERACFCALPGIRRPSARGFPTVLFESLVGGSIPGVLDEPAVLPLLPVGGSSYIP